MHGSAFFPIIGRRNGFIPAVAIDHRRACVREIGDAVAIITIILGGFAPLKSLLRSETLPAAFA